jgi:glycogen(starch) synthase
LSIGLLFPPHSRGGYELMCEGAMLAARARGHEVQIVVSDYRDPLIHAPDLLAVDRGLRSYLDGEAQAKPPPGLRETVRLERHNRNVLDRHLHEFAPDVVSWWGMGGMSLSLIERVRRAGLPSVLCVEDHWLSYGPEADAWARTVRRWRLRSLAPLLEPLCGLPMRCDLAHAGRFLFNSAYTRDAAIAAGFRSPDCAIANPGVHHRYSPAPPAGWRGRLLYVGRLDPTKGVDVIIDALAALPSQSTLRVIGSGESAYEAALRSQAHSLGLDARVEFSGAFAPEQMPSAYEAADAVIFPVRWEEPWGLVPLEAMAVGRPVIATSRGGAASYLRDEENALLMPVDDAEALGAAVRRLAGSEQLRAKLRAGGFVTAHAYSAESRDGVVVDELERAGGEREGAS